MVDFIQGRELSRIFYEEAVRPLLNQHFPDLVYTAGRFGNGSDVLGFDTAMSRDHDWGPTLYLFLQKEDISKADTIRDLMATQLPREIRGYSTHFGHHEADGTQVMEAATGRINHRVHVMTVQQYLWYELRWDSRQPLKIADWLSIPSQKLRIIAEGWVHFDNASDWQAIREQLAWYPHDIWLYMMAASWQRIGQEDHLHGRAGYVGDELGSHIIAARLVRDMMQLCFLQEKIYAPYPKWFGSAFQQLDCAAELSPILQAALQSETWQVREEHLVQAYGYIARQHNALQITPPMPDKASQFHERPFQVIHNTGIGDALLEAITDAQVQALRQFPSLIGSIDHFSDSTDLRSSLAWCEKVRGLYQLAE